MGLAESVEISVEVQGVAQSLFYAVGTEVKQGLDVDAQAQEDGDRFLVLGGLPIPHVGGMVREPRVIPSCRRGAWAKVGESSTGFSGMNRLSRISLEQAGVY